MRFRRALLTEGAPSAKLGTGEARLGFNAGNLPSGVNVRALGKGAGPAPKSGMA